MTKNEFKTAKIEEAEQMIRDAINLVRAGSWTDVDAVIAALHKFCDAKTEETLFRKSGTSGRSHDLP